MHNQSDMHVPGSSVNGPGNFVVLLHGFALGSLFSLGSNPGQSPNVSFLNGTIGAGPRGSEVPGTTHLTGVFETPFGETYFVSFILLANGVFLEL